MPENKSATALIALNLFDNLPQKFFYKDKNLDYVLCNENYAKDLKIKASAIKGKNDFDFYPKDLAKKYRSDDIEVIKSGGKKEIEEEYIIDNEKYWVHTIKIPIKENQEIIGVLGIFWDISDYKRIEQELREEKNLFQKLSEASFEAIVIHENGVILEVNQAFVKMLDIN